MILSEFQREWLTSRGGRTEKDVWEDEKGPFVRMYKPPTVIDPKDWEEIRLPK